ncbi:MAG: carbonic anhydrase family protein [Zoogloeaceae bacterium]|nr:carbonic anhydrase family protein [Zoogloeaceae bacterium]
MRLRPVLFILAIASGGSLQAADWVSVSGSQARKAEIDRASILQSDPGTKVAWGRIVLPDDEADKAGYKVIKALNRYDCRTGTFTTIKRAYLDRDAHLIREERVAEPKVMNAAPRSVDERLWYEVCKPPSVDDLQKVAVEAGRAASAEKETGSARHADYRPAETDTPPEKRTVADGHAAPAEAHGAEAPAEAAAPRAPLIKLPPPPAPEPAPAVAHEPVHAAPPPVEHRAPRRVPSRPARKVLVAHAAPKVDMSPVVEHHEIHWDYSGPGGPESWGTLRPEYAQCAKGGRQSPIDVRDGIRVDLQPIEFDYKPTYFRIIDNGHTVQVNVGEGSTIRVMGRQYDLVQFHFHRPSEERINGRGFDMVAHLVHKDLDGRLAVVAVLLQRGSDHPLVQTLWNNLPLEKNVGYAPDVSIDLNQLLPEDRRYYTYMGSLTTPPCTEGVLWMVMKQPVSLSAEQIGIFSRLYPMNARPVQPAGDRLIKESR